jgi:hypothetical protein
LESLLEVLTGDTLLESGINGGSFGGMEKIPAFRLRFPIHGCGGLHRRVDLDREALTGIKELDQERETGGGVRGVQGSEDFLTVSDPQVVKCLSLKGAFMHHALGLWSVDHFPEFPDRNRVGQYFTQKGLEPAPPPDAFHGQRLESDRR